MSQTIRRCALTMLLTLFAARSAPGADPCDGCRAEPSPPTGPQFALICDNCYIVDDCAASYPTGCQPMGECSEYQGVASTFMKCS
jgi:hypothetical protein